MQDVQHGTEGHQVSYTDDLLLLWTMVTLMAAPLARVPVMYQYRCNTNVASPHLTQGCNLFLLLAQQRSALPHGIIILCEASCASCYIPSGLRIELGSARLIADPYVGLVPVS